MNKGVKLIVIVGLIFLWFILSFLLLAVRQEAGEDGPGYFAFILLVGLIAGIRAVWKHTPENSNEKSKKQEDKYKLDKN